MSDRLQGHRPDLPSKIMPVWRREMRGNGYLAPWVSAITAEGPVRAMTFVVNRASERYAGRLSDQEIAAHITMACGHIGPSAEYLLNTVARCEELGVHDPYLWRMQAWWLADERRPAEEAIKTSVDGLASPTESGGKVVYDRRSAPSTVCRDCALAASR